MIDVAKVDPKQSLLMTARARHVLPAVDAMIHDFTIGADRFVLRIVDVPAESTFARVDVIDSKLVMTYSQPKGREVSSLIWTIVAHELGHAAEVSDEQYFVPNFGMISFEALEENRNRRGDDPKKWSLTFEKARAHLLAEARTIFLTSMILRGAWPTIAKATHALSVAAMAICCPIENSQVTELLSQAKAETQDRDFDPWAEVERKLALMAGSPV